MTHYSQCVVPLMFVTSSEALTLSNLMGAILTPPVFGLDGDVPTSVFAAHMHSTARLVPLAGPATMSENHFVPRPMERTCAGDVNSNTTRTMAVK